MATRDHTDSADEITPRARTLPRCKVALSNPAWNGSGSVSGIIRDRAFTATGMDSFASGLFSAGLLTWSSGANAWRKAEVLLHERLAGQVTITLLEAPVRAIETGNDFTVQAGCDKSAGTCGARFDNILNFRGFPHIPGQEAVLRYAAPGKGQSGEPL